MSDSGRTLGWREDEARERELSEAGYRILGCAKFFPTVERAERYARRFEAWTVVDGRGRAVLQSLACREEEIARLRRDLEARAAAWARDAREGRDPARPPSARAADFLAVAAAVLPYAMAGLWRRRGFR